MMNNPIPPAEGTDAPAPLILIIEDEEMILELERMVLTRSGYRVCGFGSGEAALAAPPELLRDAVRDAMKKRNWSLQADAKGLPVLILSEPGGATYTGTFTLAGQDPPQVQVQVQVKVGRP